MSALNTFSSEAVSKLKKFRFASARATTPQALILEISKADFSINISQNEDGQETLTSIEEVIDSLPANSPRFIALSYPLTLPDGRKSYPFVLIYYRPATSTQDLKMLYAGATELVRNEVGVSKMIEIEDEEEFEDIECLIV
ncbi:cofilin/tropomyosin-type actin-binding protein [Nadsonia fulvescens var. elongata DSM 6958]|uniref:Cofilin/tropomyosin-type actin-binding protein n=1 Tax=Nadsonia fulvescens var. elongata DSM 6958 TaxID=857566 RepID=A0A1E3PQR4_9ASCO|nr:cofilin/tropomyosin-type actin-binding protein [Nadsonia fulvescens var. elongata DSM 6958]